MALWLTDTDVPLRRLEDDVTRLLGTGLLDAALDRLADGGPPSPFTELVELDVRSRRFEAGLPDLQRLQERLRTEPAAHTRFGLWAEAVVAERMLMDGDMASARWAATLLDTTTDEPYPPLPVLYARARIQRIAAIGFLYEPSPANRAAFRRCRDAAVEDFGRCGFAVECAVTQAVAATGYTLMTLEQPREAIAQIERARAVVADVPGCSWQPLLDAIAGSVSLSQGDLTAARRYLTRAGGSTGDQFARFVGQFGLALGALIESGGDPATLTAVDEAIADAGRVSTRHEPALQALVAHVLADLGRPEMIRYAHPALAAPQIGPVSEPEERLLRLRVDLMAGVAPPADEARSPLAALGELQLDRSAAMHAARLARDYDGLGQHNEAEWLRSWAHDRLPRPEERTTAELMLGQLRRDPPAHRGGGPTPGRSHPSPCAC